MPCNILEDMHIYIEVRKLKFVNFILSYNLSFIKVTLLLLSLRNHLLKDKIQLIKTWLKIKQYGLLKEVGLSQLD